MVTVGTYAESEVGDYRGYLALEKMPTTLGTS